MQRIHLYKKIILYKDAVENVDEIYNFYKNSEDWHSWGIFGTMFDLNDSSAEFENFPEEHEWQEYVQNTLLDYSKNSFGKDLLWAFYKSTKDYVGFTDSSIENWKFHRMTNCFYETKSGISEDKAMPYHTDAMPEFKDEPGDKFAITCLIYLNDDYEGGDLMFRVYDETKDQYDAFSYKPKAGDIIIFPSAEPYFHGVSLVTSGRKMFTRSFWFFKFKGTEEWWKNFNQYGEAAWKEMEEKRKEVFRQSLVNKKDNKKINDIIISKENYETL
jgi:hypothetical protein